MDSKMKELSMEEMDMVTGGLEVTEKFIFTENKEMVKVDEYGNPINPKNN